MSQTAMVPYELLRGCQKAAILMTVLGDDAAALLFRNLPEDDLQVITRDRSTSLRMTVRPIAPPS